MRADKPASESASRVNVSRQELTLRPRQRPADVLEAAPGLFVAQHAGGGKASQYFLRGFDADHGTDVAFFIDGVPVNMPSHAHGQGYADLQFLIPELVVSLDTYKGPYYAHLGDFATAGAINLRLAESFDESHASLSAGQYGTWRGLVVASPHVDDAWRTVLAAELSQEDGPFQNPQKNQKLNAFARATRDLGAGKLSFTWMSYGASWNGSGQIPARAVCGEGESRARAPSTFGAACLDRFGSIDPTEGGATQRHLGSIAYSTRSDASETSAMAYVIRYRYNLYSNFTFFDRNPTQGDQIEQSDDRTAVGGDFRARQHWHYRASRLLTSVGFQARYDDMDSGLFDARARTRMAARVDSAVAETSLGAYAQADARLTDAFRFIAGVRAERIDASVHDRLELGASGTSAKMALLPKLSWIVSPHAKLDVFAQYGRGFHSHDARAAVRGGALLTPASGYELGARVRPIEGLTVQAAAFLLDLDSELVWVGDEGTTEASGRTRRAGIEVGARQRLGDWLFADIDATFTRARYRDDAAASVPLAPIRTLTAGLGAKTSIGSFSPFGSIRIKSMADRPASDDGALVADGYTLLGAMVGTRYKDVEMVFDVQNILGTRWREVAFAGTSRLPYEPEAVTGVHYTPGWPRTVMARATLYWR